MHYARWQSTMHKATWQSSIHYDTWQSTMHYVTWQSTMHYDTWQSTMHYMSVFRCVSCVGYLDVQAFVSIVMCVTAHFKCGIWNAYTTICFRFFLIYFPSFGKMTLLSLTQINLLNFCIALRFTILHGHD